MNDKCSKYEGLFVFSDNETLEKHLEECEECRIEHEKMQKVSELIDEVKFHYKLKRKNTKIRLRAVCAFALLLFFGATFSIISNDVDLSDKLAYEESLSAEELGFPVDSYGLIMVDE